MKNKAFLRILISAFVICLLIASASLSALPVSASETVTDGIFTYTFSYYGWEISSVDKSASGHITVPAYFGDYAVMYIGEGAFQNCVNIESISFAEYASLKYISNDAFSGCTGLKHIDLPNISYDGFIGDYAFANCTSLESIDISRFYGNLNNGAFAGCTSLKEVKMPDMMNWIRDYVFRGCTSLESITLPRGNASKVGKHLFEDCVSLKSVTLSPDTKEIGDWAFSGCSSLESIHIPAGVTDVGKYAFQGCRSLSSITVAEGNAKYHAAGNCLIETATKNVVGLCKTSVIPEDGSVTSIGVGSYPSCIGLTSLTIPESITELGEHALSGCYPLTEVLNKSSLEIVSGSSDTGYKLNRTLNIYSPSSGESKLHTTADGFVFYCDGDNVILVSYDGNKKQLDLPESYNGMPYSIGAYAFAYATIESINIPNSVTEIDYSAFYKCLSLKEVNFASESRLERIGDQAFSRCSALERISPIPSSVSEIGEYVFDDCKMLNTLTFEKNSSLKLLPEYAFAYLPLITEFVIPEGVSSISDYVFSDCTSLKTVTVPPSVKNIDEGAFSSIASDILIKCHEDSAAHIFAANNSIPFELIHFTNDRGVCYACLDMSGTTSDKTEEENTNVSDIPNGDVDAESNGNISSDNGNSNENENENENDNENDDVTPSGTEADVSDDDRDVNNTSSGCNSVIGSGAVALVSAIALCTASIIRKKDD